MGTVIDLVTGLPIDYEVLSNCYFKCKAAENQKDDKVWKAKHSMNCHKNFDGSASAMEAVCAERLWSRSVDSHQLRYITILCNGDSKAFDAVSKLVLYGPEYIIEKEDCINHVSKRMGSALRNLVSVSKARNDNIFGKGKLTQDKISKIQNYYGRAIKGSASDIQLLKTHIMAILMQLSSTDSSPRHLHCPPGDHLGVFWQKGLAESADPGTHKDHDTLPMDIGKKLVPIFKRLSDEVLLERLHGVKHKTLMNLCTI
eukprot:gene838-10581_t